MLFLNVDEVEQIFHWDNFECTAYQQALKLTIETLEQGVKYVQS